MTLTKHGHQFQYRYCTECYSLQRLLPDLSDARTELKVKQTEVPVNLLVRNDAFAALLTGYGKSPMLYVLAKNIRHFLSTSRYQSIVQVLNYCLLKLQKPSVVSKTLSTHSVVPDCINNSPESRL